MRAVALALVTLAACGRADFDPIGDGGRPDADPITNPPPLNYTAGTRLRAAIYRGGDVAWRYIWHDMQLDVDCFAATMTDGTLRCVPQDATTQAAYGDAACTQPLGFRASSLDACSTVAYSSSRDGDVWTTRSVVGPHAGPVYANLSGTCQVIDASRSSI